VVVVFGGGGWGWELKAVAYDENKLHGGEGGVEISCGWRRR